VRIGMCEDRLFLSDGQEFVFEKTEPVQWRSAVDFLPRVLASYKGRKASLILADQFVHYALLPWSDTLKTHAQWLALARHRFVSIHGPIAEEWEVKFAETAPSGPRLACAAERGLIDSLSDAFNGSGVHLVSVQPFLVTAYNRVRQDTGGTCWLVVEEPGRLTLAFLQQGLWIAIRSRRADERWRRVLPEIIERESALLGLEERCTRVIVCAQGSFDADQHEDFRTQALEYHQLALGNA
jgi:hypothetical protein